MIQKGEEYYPGEEHYLVGGFITESNDAYCMTCYLAYCSPPDEETEEKDERTIAALRDTFEDGLACGKCGEWIVEPRVQQ